MSAARETWLLVHRTAADYHEPLTTDRDAEKRKRRALDLARAAREQLEGLEGVEPSATCAVLRVIEAALGAGT